MTRYRMITMVAVMTAAASAGLIWHLAFQAPSTDIEHEPTNVPPPGPPPSPPPQTVTVAKPTPQPHATGTPPAIVEQPAVSPARPLPQPRAGAGSLTADGLAAQISAIMESEGSRNDQRQQLAALGRRLATDDFAAALRLVLNVEDGRTRSYVLAGMLEAKAATDPQAALLAALDLQPQLDNGEVPGFSFRGRDVTFRTALDAALRGWARTEPGRALDYARDLPDRYQSQSLKAVYTSWAQADPLAAVASASEHTGQQQRAMLETVYREWAENDAQAAVVHASEYLEDGSYRNAIVARGLREWAAADLDEAVAWVDETVPDDVQFSSMLRHVARGLAYSEPAKAARLLDMYPELDMSSRDLTYRLVDQWSKRDPAAAAAWVEAIEDPAKQAEAVKATASNWTSSNYEEALSWAQSLAGAKTRAYALSNVALQLAEKDMERSTAWITALPPGFARDRSVAGYTLGTLRRNRDYRNARELQSQIGNEAVDLQKVRAIIDRSRLPDTQKADLLGMF